jgi:hypothetical protein
MLIEETQTKGQTAGDPMSFLLSKTVGMFRREPIYNYETFQLVPYKRQNMCDNPHNVVSNKYSRQTTQEYLSE